MLSLLLIAVFLFVGSHAACSSHTTVDQCDADNDCNWKTGRCNPFSSADCSVSNCKVGCIYTAPVAGTCENQLTETCAGRGGDSCDDDGSCGLTDGTCVLSSPSPSCPETPLENWENCPAGCQEIPDPFCELPPQDSGEGENGNCDDHSLTPISECTYHESCEWSSTTNKCVSRPSTGDWPDSSSSCEGYSNSPVSECELGEMGEACKVSSGSCVFDSSGLSSQCSGLDTTSTISECEYQGGDECVKDGNKCVSRPSSGDYPDGNSSSSDYCNELSVLPVSKCEMFGCVKQGSTCTFSVSKLDDMCDSEYGVEYCTLSDGGFCKISNNKCVFAANDFCGRMSTIPITECAMYESQCKVSNNQCVNLSPDELCSAYDVVSSMSECQSNSFCHSQRGVCALRSEYSEDIENCAAATNNMECYDLDYSCNWIDGQAEGSGVCESYYSQYQELCSSLSTTLTVSECNVYSYGQCEVNSNGVCVSHVYTPPDCVLNQGKSACNNPISDGCNYGTKKKCVLVTCGDYSDSDSCAGQGCVWSLTQSCVPDTTKRCSPNSDGSCESTSPPNCESQSATTENCVVDTSVSTTANCNKATTSACNQATGCKWNTTDGGTCVEKTCSGSPSYARCCPSQDANCAYCSGLLSKPSDCPVIITNPSCSNSPSYSNCCPGDGCSDFCASHPEEVKCKSSGSNIFAPFIALLLLLLILL